MGVTIVLNLLLEGLNEVIYVKDLGAPACLSHKSMQLLISGVMSSRPTLSVGIKKKKNLKKRI